MTEYEKIRSALKSRCRNITHFSKAFYDIYKNAVKKEDFSEIFKTDFYTKNGCAYCTFLEIVNE